MTREEELERAQEDLTFALDEAERANELLKTLEEESDEWYAEFLYIQEMENDAAYLNAVIRDLEDDA
jgi:lysylphosphatidylglycerol synthetase-like protein (DUF2156 family)